MSDSRAEYRAHLLRHQLSEIVGAEHTSVNKGERQDQAVDWSWMSQLYQLHDLELPMADVVVRPGSAEEVAEVMAVASDQRVPVVPRGGGSGTQGGTFALYGGIALDVSRMDKIIDIDESSMVVKVEAGVTGPQLEKVLGRQGLAVAHEPGSFHFGATVGGWLAARGSGVRSTKYGKSEDQVLQLEVALPPGELVSTLPVPNHAAGPGLLQLVVGSEGTMGTITTATMRMDPIPESMSFLTFEFETVFDGLEAGRRIMTERLRPAVMRLYDEADREKLSKILGIEFSGALMVIVCDGDQRLVDLESEMITEICVDVGGADLGESGAKTWWDGRYEPYAMGKAPRPPTIFGTTDTVCTFADMPDLYRAKRKNVEEGFAEYGATYTAHFSHWYPWGVMVYDRFYVHDAPEDPMESLALHDRLWDAAIKVSLEHGGVINEHHGIGIKLGRFMREQYGTAWPVMQRIKDAIDPDGILNPGKLGFGPPR